MVPRSALALVTALTISLALISPPVHGQMSDPATTANISMYPKPHKLGDLSLQSTTGTSVSLKDFQGKVVLLRFWSINCPACRMEEPLLEHVKRTFGPAGLEVLAVNLVDTPQAVSSHAMAHRMPFQVLFDGGRGFSLKVVSMGGRNTAFLLNPLKEAILEVPGFPTTYIVDCRGSAVGYSIGPAKWDSGYAVGLLQNLLSQCKNHPSTSSTVPEGNQYLGLAAR